MWLCSPWTIEESYQSSNQGSTRDSGGWGGVESRTGVAARKRVVCGAIRLLTQALVVCPLSKKNKLSLNKWRSLEITGNVQENVNLNFLDYFCFSHSFICISKSTLRYAFKPLKVKSFLHLNILNLCYSHSHLLFHLSLVIIFIYSFCLQFVFLIFYICRCSLFPFVTDGSV